MNPGDIYEAIQKIWKKSGWSKDDDGDDAFLAEAKWAVLEGTKKLKVCYHGTDEEAARLILKEGFRSGTYFGEHLDDAIDFGECVFEVCFSQDTASRSGWQFVCPDSIPVDRIVGCKVYGDAEILYENEALGEKIFRSNLTEEEKKRLDDKNGSVRE